MAVKRQQQKSTKLYVCGFNPTLRRMRQANRGRIQVLQKMQHPLLLLSRNYVNVLYERISDEVPYAWRAIRIKHALNDLES